MIAPTATALQPAATLDWPLLRALAPPDFVLHLGAGQGQGALHQWRQWPVPHALLIDAEDSRLHGIGALTQAHPGWQTCAALIAEHSGPADYHRTSHPDENGLLPATALAALWPNLRAQGQETRPALSLAELLNDPELAEPLKAAEHPWLLIDALPAAALLRGAGAVLDNASLIAARVLLDPVPGLDPDCQLDSVQSLLQPQGYRLIAVLETNHPNIAHAVFLRDWRAVLQPRMMQLTTERDTQAQQATSRQQQLDTLTQEKAQLAQARDEQAKLAQQRQIQIDALNQEQAQLAQARDEQAKLAQERQTQIDTLTQQKAQLTQERDQARQQLSQAQQERDQSRQRLQDLEQERDQLLERHSQFGEEMARAEGQIELIKDLLLRESAQP